MLADIKVRYKGSNPDYTYDGIYQVLAIVGDSSSRIFVLLNDIGVIGAITATSADVEIVSVHTLSAEQIYP